MAENEREPFRNEEEIYRLAQTLRGANEKLKSELGALAIENERLLRSLETNNLITYGTNESTAIILQLRERNNALKQEISLLQTKLNDSVTLQRRYQMKWINLVKKHLNDKYSDKKE